jgi:hypothetical protein
VDVNEKQVDEEIADLFQHTWTYPDLLRIHTRAVRLADLLFGATSEEVSGLRSLRSLYELPAQDQATGEKAQNEWRDAIHGFLTDFRNAIKRGVLTRMRVSIQGEVLGDFLALAKRFRDEKHLDVAGVLVAAGLEDGMKRCARNAGIVLPDKADLSTAANALISKRVIDGAEKSMVQGLLKFRNDALHANWSGITDTSLQSAIGFLEGFLQKHF